MLNTAIITLFVEIRDYTNNLLCVIVSLIGGVCRAGKAPFSAMIPGAVGPNREALRLYRGTYLPIVVVPVLVVGVAALLHSSSKY